MRISDWSSDVCSSDLYHSTTRSRIVYYISCTIVWFRDDNIFTFTDFEYVVAVIAKLQLRYYPRNFINAQLIKYTTNAPVQDFNPIKRTVGCINNLCLDRKSNRLNSSH